MNTMSASPHVSVPFSRRQACRALLLALALLLHTQKPLLFSVNPLPPALLAAAPDGGTVFLLLLSFLPGLLPGLRSDFSQSENIRLFAVLLAVTAIRVFCLLRTIFRQRAPWDRLCLKNTLLADWKESRALRGFWGFASALLWALWHCGALGFTYYALWGSLFILLASLPLTFLWTGLFLPAKNGADTVRTRLWQGTAGALLLCLSAVAGRSVVLWQIALLPAFALALAFSAGGRRQFLQSAVLILAGMGGYAPILLPAGGGAVLLFALFRRFSRVLATAAGTLGFLAIVWGLKGEVTVLSLLPTVLAGALGYLFCTRFGENAALLRADAGEKKEPVPPDSGAENSPPPVQASFMALQCRLSDLASALAGIAELCRSAETAVPTEGNGKATDAPASVLLGYSALYNGAAALLREMLTAPSEDLSSSASGSTTAGENAVRVLRVTPAAFCRPAPGSLPAGTSRRHIPCGDAVRLFEGRAGCYYALLCDGMGSGVEAARVAGFCAAFAERLLRASVSPPLVLTLLNQYLCARSRFPAREQTCAIDLLELRLAGGRGRFFKCGAAASAVIRGSQLYCPSAHTLPLGILAAPDLQCISFAFQPGDRILLLSDGITEGATNETDFLRHILAPCLADSASDTVASPTNPTASTTDAVFSPSGTSPRPIERVESSADAVFSPSGSTLSNTDRATSSIDAAPSSSAGTKQSADAVFSHADSRPSPAELLFAAAEAAGSRDDRTVVLLTLGE